MVDPFALLMYAFATVEFDISSALNNFHNSLFLLTSILIHKAELKYDFASSKQDWPPRSQDRSGQVQN